MIREKERELKDILMETNMKAIFIKEKLMVKVFIIGLMEKFMMENGWTVSKKDMECGGEYLEILT